MDQLKLIQNLEQTDETSMTKVQSIKTVNPEDITFECQLTDNEISPEIHSQETQLKNIRTIPIELTKQISLKSSKRKEEFER